GAASVGYKTPRRLGGAAPHDRLVWGARARARRRGRIHRYVVAHAGCPVLTVPAPPLARHELRALRRASAYDFAAAGPAG
ncbi:hypothetical protein ACFWWP_12210, partial [Streptomyces sp. NPDC058695]